MIVRMEGGFVINTFYEGLFFSLVRFEVKHLV